MAIAMVANRFRLMSTAARTIKRPTWVPPDTLRFPLKEIDGSTVTASNWVPPQGGYESLPFRVRRLNFLNPASVLLMASAQRDAQRQP